MDSSRLSQLESSVVGAAIVDSDFPAGPLGQNRELWLEFTGLVHSIQFDTDDQTQANLTQNLTQAH